MTAPTLLVVAKAPVPGAAKTRLTPPYSPAQAADLAAAALLDTLDAAVQAAQALAAGRVVVALTGDLADAERSVEIAASLTRCRVIPQRGRGLAGRLVAAHLDGVGSDPVLQIGMDTPQVSAELLVRCADLLSRSPAVLGGAEDGGWWLLGLADARTASALAGVAMSSPSTGQDTLAALVAHGLAVAPAPVLRDVDTGDDVPAVARSAPRTRFARTARRIGQVGAELPASDLAVAR